MYLHWFTSGASGLRSEMIIKRGVNPFFQRSPALGFPQGEGNWVEGGGRVGVLLVIAICDGSVLCTWSCWPMVYLVLYQGMCVLLCQKTFNKQKFSKKKAVTKHSAIQTWLFRLISFTFFVKTQFTFSDFFISYNVIQWSRFRVCHVTFRVEIIHKKYWGLSSKEILRLNCCSVCV